MRCAECGADELRVADSRPYGKDARWRRRECGACGARCTTVEMVFDVNYARRLATAIGATPEQMLGHRGIALLALADELGRRIGGEE